MFKAIHQGDWKELDRLIATRQNVNIEDDICSGTPLDAAVFFWTQGTGVHMVKALIAAKANINHLDKNRQTPLFHAVCGENLAGVRLLLEAKALTDCPGGESPLFIAASRGQADVVKILLNAGANKEVRDKLGNDMTTIAMFNGYKEVVEILGGKMPEGKLQTNIASVFTKLTSHHGSERFNPGLYAIKKQEAHFSEWIEDGGEWFCRECEFHEDGFPTNYCRRDPHCWKCKTPRPSSPVLN